MCGNGTRQDGFIDFQIYYDYEGYVYLCMLCFEETLNVLGLLTKVEADSLRAIAASHAAENLSLKKELEEANARLSQYDSLIGSVVSRVPSISVLAEQGTPTSGKGIDDAPVGIADPADAGEPVSSEPVKVSRSNDSSQSKRGNSKRVTSGGLSL